MNLEYKKRLFSSIKLSGFAIRALLNTKLIKMNLKVSTPSFDLILKFSILVVFQNLAMAIYKCSSSSKIISSRLYRLSFTQNIDKTSFKV